jgi:hypothetical protein
MNESNGSLSHKEAQYNIDSLMNIAREIYTDPNNTSREWFGHSYLRWSSFTNFNPTETILSLNIPVFIVSASDDKNTSVLGTDYLRLESIRMGKDNIKFLVVPYDHSFNEIIHDHNGKVISVKNHMREIVEEALTWLKQNMNEQ